MSWHFEVDIKLLSCEHVLTFLGASEAGLVVTSLNPAATAGHPCPLCLCLCLCFCFCLCLCLCLCLWICCMIGKEIIDREAVCWWNERRGWRSGGSGWGSTGNLRLLVMNMFISDISRISEILTTVFVRSDWIYFSLSDFNISVLEIWWSTSPYRLRVFYQIGWGCFSRASVSRKPELYLWHLTEVVANLEEVGGACSSSKWSLTPDLRLKHPHFASSSKPLNCSQKLNGFHSASTPNFENAQSLCKFFHRPQCPLWYNLSWCMAYGTYKACRLHTLLAWCETISLKPGNISLPSASISLQQHLIRLIIIWIES